MMERREFIQNSAGSALLSMLVAAGLVPATALAADVNAPGWNAAAFSTKSMVEAVKALGGSNPIESKDIILSAPEIAENGNLVRLAAESKIPNTSEIAFVVEKNPFALTATFDIPAGTDANVATNVRMARTTRVYAVAKADDKFYYAAKEVKVTLGGCGG